MVNVWARVEFSNGDTTFQVGDPVELPQETDEEKQYILGLLSRGVLTRTEPAATRRAREEEPSSGRIGRGKRN